MLQSTARPHPLESMSHLKPSKSSQSKGTAIAILSEIWPEYDHTGQGILATMMDTVLRRVEEEQGSPLLDQSGWEQLAAYTDRVGATVVCKQDLENLLGILQALPSELMSSPQPYNDTNDLYGNNSNININDDFLQNQYYSQRHPHAPENDLGRHPVDHHEHHRHSTYQDQPQRQHHHQGQQFQFQEENNRLRQSSRSPALSHSRSHQHNLARPRPGIRKISLSESSSNFRSWRSKTQEPLSNDESDDGGRHVSSNHDSHGTASGRSSGGSSPSINTESKDWRMNPYSMSVHKSATEYEGLGMEAEEAEEERKMNSSAIEVLQRRLVEKKTELEELAYKKANEELMYQEKIDTLLQDLKKQRDEISGVKTTEEAQSLEIKKLEQQIAQAGEASSNQKNSVVALKLQLSEHEQENVLLQGSLKTMEDALDDAMIQLKTYEAEARRINADRETMKELRQQLAEAISKNEDMTWQLELMNSEKLRLAELNGSLKSEVETLGGMAAASAAKATLVPSSPSVQGKTLMSELESVGATFSPGSDLNGSEDKNMDSPEAFDSKKVHDGARRLLQENTSLTNKLKRSSIRDLNQRFKEGAADLVNIQTKESPSYTQSMTMHMVKSSNQQAEEGAQYVDSVIVKHRADDVDCALPPELTALDNKERLLTQELGTQAGLIENLEDLFKAQSLTPQIGVSFDNDAILGPPVLLANRQQRERARRRKMQSSRVLTQAEVVDLLNPGAIASSGLSSSSSSSSTNNVSTSHPGRVMNRRENKNIVANVTLVSMYTIVVYLFGVITSVFLVDNGQPGFNYGRFLSFDALEEAAMADMNAGGPGRFKVVEILVYWIQNLVFQGDVGYPPT
ncbi:hypothetical protein BG004_000746 [Podila humilis]|nr:hypothetical protein BG004_000746 [Podila humilis]